MREIVSRVYEVENERQSRVSELYYSMYPEYEPSSMGNTDHEDGESEKVDTEEAKDATTPIKLEGPLVYQDDLGYNPNLI